MPWHVPQACRANLPTGKVLDVVGASTNRRKQIQLVCTRLTTLCKGPRLADFSNTTLRHHQVHSTSQDGDCVRNTRIREACGDNFSLGTNACGPVEECVQRIQGRLDWTISFHRDWQEVTRQLASKHKADTTFRSAAASFTVASIPRMRRGKQKTCNSRQSGVESTFRPRHHNLMDLLTRLLLCRSQTFLQSM